ncbi:MAG: amidohydrolase [Planctomycetota bacterium]|nr:MAG: amidohydrolase [Planctomycetota bacterium]
MSLSRLVTRRRALAAIGAGAVSLVGARIVLPEVWRTGAVGQPDEETLAFVLRCLDGLEQTRLVDTHVHLAGTETALSGCWLNPAMKSWLRPGQRLRYELFMGAAGVEAEAGGDAQYVSRLLERHRAANPQGKLLVLGFERYHDDEGRPDAARSVMHVPDEYVLGLAEEHADLLPCVSIHPYRPDAVERLNAAVKRGARAVKWLPSAMNIDPASPKCRPFYEALVARGVPLISHAGEESSLTLTALQELNNPLRLRSALEHGVTVVVAHAGSLGRVDDLDHSGGSSRRLPSFDAFMRLFRDPRYERQLFADISALAFVNRAGRPLRELLLMSDQHHRLVNGSDYPVCCVDPVTNTLLLQWQGYLDGEDRRLLGRVFELNPLLFDLCLKRCLRVEHQGREHRFSPVAFESEWLLERLA